MPDLASRVTRPDDFVLLADAARRAVRLHDDAPPHAPEAVERPPVPSADNPCPAYPAGLARESVGDTVVVQFVADSTGVVESGSVELLRGSHASFAQAVRAVPPRLRFLPGQLGARAVRAVVQQPFLFRPEDVA